ncbi:gliding motility-associated C-terminal domain-containing protein [bacterium]|nr:gliding motility-associated C-terminal domain-containing protein [bacterium]
MLKRTILFFFSIGLAFASESVVDKASLAPDETMESMVIQRLENGYIAIDVDLDGDDGNYEEGADLTGGGSYVKLTFGWPSDGWSEWMMFYVDGFSNKTQHDAIITASDTQYVRTDSTACVQWNDYHGVMIRIEFHPVSLGAFPGQIEQIKYKVVMKPSDGSTHTCGAMIFWDTMINTNDGAPISTSYGYSGTADIFYAPGIPTIWRAYEGIFPPAPGDVQALGILTGYEATMPDVFWYGSWGTGVGLGWNTAGWTGATGGPYIDSAVMTKWDERLIADGDSVIFVTYYGIGNFATTDVTITHTPPTILPDCDGTMNPDTTDFNFMIINGGTADVCNVIATLTGTGFNFLTTPNPINIGTLAGYGGAYNIDWDVLFNPSVWGTTQQYIFTLDFDDCAGHDSTIVDTFELYIPHPSDIALNVSADDSVLCPGESTQVHASFSGTYGSVFYMWSPSYNISDPSSLDPIVYPDFTSTYTFTVSDSNGCISTGYVFIVVDQIFAEAGGDISVCSGDSAMIGGVPTVSGGIPPFTYNWTPSAGLSDPSAPNPYAHPDTSTMYYVDIIDGNSCTATDSVFVSVSQSPYTYFILPDSCGGIISCNPPQFELVVADPETTIDPAMFGGYINGVWYNASSGVFSYSDTILTITPVITFANGETVLVELTQYQDFDGCRGEAVRCSVIVDSEPPQANMTNPTPGTAIVDPSPTITINITDSPAGIDTNSFDYISVYLNGIPVTGFIHSWTDPTLELTGFDFADGGTVMVCLDSLWDTPDYPYCPPNDTSFCWTFVVTTGNVIAFPNEPTDMQSTACDNQILTISLWGSVNAVDTSSIVLVVDDVVYTIDSTYVNYNLSDSTLSFDPGAAFWLDNDTICIALWAADIYGGAMDDTMRYCFITDFSPPYIYNTIPDDGETVTTLEPSFQFNISDLITGVDSILVTIDDTVILGVDSGCVNFDGTTFSFDADCAGLSYPPDEDVQVCVNAFDSPDLCEPNELDTCWTFVVSMLCSLDADAGGDIDLCVGSSTILGGYPVATDGTPPYDYLWTLDDGSFVSDLEHPSVSPTAPTVYIVTVTDSLGCTDADTVFVYAHNCAGPSASIIHPLDEMWTSCDPESIIFTINDSDGIVDSTILIRVNMVEYTTDSTQVHWSEPTLVFIPSTPFADGETVYVDIFAAEDIYGNPLEGAPISWRFYIDYTPPQIWGESPSTDEIISNPYVPFTLRIDDDGSGLDTNSLQIWVGSMHFTYGDTCLDVGPGPGGAFTIVNIDSNCLPMNPCDTVVVRIGATDSTDYCDDNILDTTWTFFTDCEPPYSEIVYPPESVWYSCVDDSIVLTILDITPGVDTSSITISATDGAGYFESATSGTPGFSYDIPSGLLIWHPSTPFPDLGTIMITVNASDYIGNAMPVFMWLFFMDRIAPAVDEFSPGCDSTIFTVNPDIYVIANDDGCGTITPSLTINGTDYTDFEFTGDTILLSPSSAPIFSGGDTVNFCWHLTDCADDICLANSTDTCCTFYVAAGGPVVTIHNPNDGDYVACTSFEVDFSIYDSDGIIADSVSISVIVDGTPSILTLSSPEILYTEFDDSISAVWTPSTITDGMTVSISVVSAYDSLYNSLAYSDNISFTFDLTPPQFANTIPANTSIVEEIAPSICVDITDDGSGIDWSLVQITINSTTYDTLNSAVGVDLLTGSLCFDPAAIGTSWVGGDSINVCVSASDSPDTCGPNESDTCWYFKIATGGPDVVVGSPAESSVVACDPDSIIWFASDPNGIDWNLLEIVLWVGSDSSFYTAESGEVSTHLLPDADSIEVVIQLPSGIADGTHITGCLIALPDSLGNPCDTTCIDFIVDYNPPFFAVISPADSDTVHSNQPGIVVELGDNGSGVNESTVVITIGSDNYTVDGNCLTYFADGDSLILNPDSCGIFWDGGTSVDICIHAEDFADSDFCGPNSLDTCWIFWISADAPIVEIVSPDDSSVTSCLPETIIIAFDDPDGIDESSIEFTIDGQILHIGDDGVTFLNDTLYYISPTPFIDGSSVEICLTAVEDMLGNGITTPVCNTFWVDYSAPTIIQTEPNNGAMVRDRTHDIVIEFYDYPAGVDSSTLNFDVNGITITHNRLIWTFSSNGDTLFVRYIPENDGMVFPPGESVLVDISVSDTTDYCFDNVMDTSIYFIVEPEVGCYLHPNPFTPNNDGKNDITIFDYPNMFSETAELAIYDIRGTEVYRKNIGPVGGFEDITPREWTGIDKKNTPLPPGIYMYIILSNGEVICSGTLVIAK